MQQQLLKIGFLPESFCFAKVSTCCSKRQKIWHFKLISKKYNKVCSKKIDIPQFQTEKGIALCASPGPQFFKNTAYQGNLKHGKDC